MKSSDTAILLVDFQGDFTSACAGPLAAMDTGEAYLGDVRRACAAARDAGLQLIATQDWHPEDHISFALNHEGAQEFEVKSLHDGRQQVLWPVHCVWDTEGAGLLLEAGRINHVVQKGTHSQFDSYSGFYDDGGRGTGLSPLLKGLGVCRLLIFGLATDYCVRDTAIDGAREGYQVSVIPSLSRPVSREGEEKALKEMAVAGVRIRQGLTVSDML